MISYGANKKTEFTKKQIGVIFANAKNGNLEIENWVISEFYNLAEYYGYDDNRNVEQQERMILNILKEVFEKKYEKAQTLINDYTEDIITRFGDKTRKNLNRNLIYKERRI